MFLFEKKQHKGGSCICIILPDAFIYTKDCSVKKNMDIFILHCSKEKNQPKLVGDKKKDILEDIRKLLQQLSCLIIVCVT